MRKYFSAQNAKFIDNGFITLQHAICRRECRFFECCKSVLKSYHFPLKKPCRVYASFKIAILICFLFSFLQTAIHSLCVRKNTFNCNYFDFDCILKLYRIVRLFVPLFTSSFPFIFYSFFKFVFCNRARKTNISSYCPSVDVCHLCLYLNRIESRICFSPSKNVGCIYFGKNMHSIFFGEKKITTTSRNLPIKLLNKSKTVIVGSPLTSLMFKIIFSRVWHL